MNSISHIMADWVSAQELARVRWRASCEVKQIQWIDCANIGAYDRFWIRPPIPDGLPKTSTTVVSADLLTAKSTPRTRAAFVTSSATEALLYVRQEDTKPSSFASELEAFLRSAQLYQQKNFWSFFRELQVCDWTKIKTDWSSFTPIVISNWDEVYKSLAVPKTYGYEPVERHYDLSRSDIVSIWDELFQEIFEADQTPLSQSQLTWTIKTTLSAKVERAVRIRVVWRITFTPVLDLTSDRVHSFTIWTGVSPPALRHNATNALCLKEVATTEKTNVVIWRSAHARGCGACRSKERTGRSPREGRSLARHLGSSGVASGRTARRSWAYRKSEGRKAFSALRSCSRRMVDRISVGEFGCV